MPTIQQMLLTRSNSTRLGTDPHFANVKLLLHGVGSNGSTTITDSSSNPKTPNSISNVTIQNNWITAGASPIVGYASNADFTLPQLFTIEATVEFSALPGNRYFLAYNASQQINVDATGAMQFYGGLSAGSGYVINTPYQIAFTRDSSNAMRTFRNGVLIATTTLGTTVGTSAFNLFSVPARADLVGPSARFKEVRLTTGVCRYTANYTPSAVPFPDSA